MPKRQYLSFKEAAREYGFSETCLRRATRNKEHPLPYHVPTGQKRGFRLFRPELDQWLQECRVVATED